MCHKCILWLCSESRLLTYWTIVVLPDNDHRLATALQGKIKRKERTINLVPCFSRIKKKQINFWRCATHYLLPHRWLSQNRKKNPHILIARTPFSSALTRPQANPSSAASSPDFFQSGRVPRGNIAVGLPRLHVPEWKTNQDGFRLAHDG